MKSLNSQNSVRRFGEKKFEELKKTEFHVSDQPPINFFDAVSDAAGSKYHQTSCQLHDTREHLKTEVDDELGEEPLVMIGEEPLEVLRSQKS